MAAPGVTRPPARRSFSRASADAWLAAGTAMARPQPHGWCDTGFPSKIGILRSDAGRTRTEQNAHAASCVPSRHGCCRGRPVRAASSSP